METYGKLKKKKRQTQKLFPKPNILKPVAEGNYNEFVLPI